MSSLSKILKLVFVALKFNIMRIAVKDHLNPTNNLVFQFSVADSHCWCEGIWAVCVFLCFSNFAGSHFLLDSYFLLILTVCCDNSIDVCFLGPITIKKHPYLNLMWPFSSCSMRSSLPYLEFLPNHWGNSILWPIPPLIKVDGITHENMA